MYALLEIGRGRGGVGAEKGSLPTLPTNRGGSDGRELKIIVCLLYFMLLINLHESITRFSFESAFVENYKK